MVKYRELWASVISALAKLSLVLALAVLATFLVLGAAHGDDAGVLYLRAGAGVTPSVPHGYGSPRDLGSLLTLLVLGIGLGILLVGGARPAQLSARR